MRRVVLESPYRGAVAENLGYARQCIMDCLRREEAPIASHVLMVAVLDDDDPHERALGIYAGLAWIDVADALVVYTDRGITQGMKVGIAEARLRKIPVEYRTLNGVKGGVMA